jgi:hypothetical protein
MREYELAGDHHGMGRRNAVLAGRAGDAPEPPTPRQLRFASECEAVVGKHAPWLLEEIRGVAEAGVIAPVAARVVPLTLYSDPGCSVVAVSGRHTPDGRPLFGRNYDFLTSFGRLSTLYKTRPEGRLAHIGCSDHWVGRHDGLNEAGLAIGHSGPPTRTRRPGFIFTLAVRAVLDTCRTVAEAATFLERIPHLQNSAFLVADASGDIAAVDVSPEEARTTRFGGGFGFLTNQYVSEEMQAHAPDEAWEQAAARPQRAGLAGRARANRQGGSAAYAGRPTGGRVRVRTAGSGDGGPGGDALVVDGGAGRSGAVPSEGDAERDTIRARGPVNLHGLTSSAWPRSP